MLTPKGPIECREVVVATNGYTGDLTPRLKRRVVPVASHIIATEELPEPASKLIPEMRAIGDTKRVLTYYRPSPDGTRLIFGGRARFTAAPPEVSAPALYQYMIDRFPQLDGIRITHVWTGNVAFALDYMPHMGTDQGVHYLLACNGNGVAMMTYLGTETAREDRRRPQRAGQSAGWPRFPRTRALQRRSFVVPADRRRLVPHARLARSPDGRLAGCFGARLRGDRGRGKTSRVTQALPVSLADIRAAASAHCRRRRPHSLPAQRDAVAHRQGRCLGEVREPAVHRLVQGTRCAQHAAAAHRRGERKRGVIAMSAGNHAQGVAYHAGRLGIPATIVMPSFTPNNKVKHTRDHGARVVLKGDTLSEAAAEAHRLADAEKLVFVHPYDDPRIIAGRARSRWRCSRTRPRLDTLSGAGGRRWHDRGLRRGGARIAGPT